jgi:hypothetical protein
MLDHILRTLSWVAALCTPRPRGRHHLGTLPPLRITPLTPPPRFTELLDGNASRLVRPYVLSPSEHRRTARLATLGIDVGPEHNHAVRVPAATR